MRRSERWPGWPAVPALVALVTLFGGGVAEAVFESRGAWGAVLAAPELPRSLALTLSLAAVSTGLALSVGLLLALGLRQLEGTRRGRWATTALQVPLAVPHLVVAISLMLLLSQSGLIARAVGALVPGARFPNLVNDELGVGIVLAFVWKEAPFVAVMVLSVLRGETLQLEAVARNLGAPRARVFRDVTLPAMVPALSFAGLVTFSYTLGSFEVPRLLGRTWPTTLGVWSWQLYTDVDLSHRPQSMVVSLLIVGSVLLPTLLWLVFARRRGVAP